MLLECIPRDFGDIVLEYCPSRSDKFSGFFRFTSSRENIVSFQSEHIDVDHRKSQRLETLGISDAVTWIAHVWSKSGILSLEIIKCGMWFNW